MTSKRDFIQLLILILLFLIVYPATINAEEYSDKKLYEELDKEANIKFPPLKKKLYRWQYFDAICFGTGKAPGATSPIFTFRFFGAGTSLKEIGPNIGFGIDLYNYSYFDFKEEKYDRLRTLNLNDFGMISVYIPSPLVGLKASSSLFSYYHYRSRYSYLNNEKYWYEYKFFGHQSISIIIVPFALLSAEFGYLWISLPGNYEKIDDINPIKMEGTFFSIDFGAQLLELHRRIDDKQIEKRKERIRKWIITEYERRSQPCDLVIKDILFDDAYSILPNNSFDAYEESYLSVSVKNNGPGDAFDVNIVPTCDNLNISFDKTSYIVGDLLPGKEASVKIVSRIDSDLKDGIVEIEIDAKEKRGYDAQKQIIKVETRRFCPPSLRIDEITLNDGTSGFADGNGNSILETGEVAELNINVVNEGEGPGLGIEAELLVPKGVEIEPLQDRFAKIPSGNSALVKYKIVLPTDYNKPELDFSLRLKDMRPIESTVLSGSISTGAIYPDIALFIDAYGVFSNGKTFPVTITVSNRGNADAKDYKLSLNTPIGVKIEPKALIFKRLAKNTQRQVAGKITIDRTYSNRSIDFSGRALSSNFDPMEVKRSYPVQINKPDLQIETYFPGGNTLLLGSGFEMAVRILNLGTLYAENVTVRISASDKLYKHRFNKTIGNIPPMKGYTEKFSFPHIPRGIGTNELNLNILVNQKDFSSLDTLAAVALTEEASIITAVESQKELPPLGFSDLGFLKTVSDTLKGLTAEGYCLLGENFNVKQAKERAELDARNRLEISVAVKITSQTVIQNYRLTSEQVRQNVSCNILNSEVIEEELEQTDEGLRYRVKIKGDVLRSVQVR